MSKDDLVFLRRYRWVDYRDRLYDTYKIVDGREVTIPKAPNPNLRYFSRTLRDDVIFFKTESDMIAYDTPCCNYDHVNKRGDYLRGVVGLE